ncbi:MAG: SURF1 family protein [Motiliproteus sp.]
MNGQKAGSVDLSTTVNPVVDLHKGSKDGATLVSKWLCLLLAITLVPLLTGLGVWQLDRADEKQRLLERADQQPVLQSLPIAHDTAQLPQAVRLQANLDDQRLLLLDNRTRQGRVGYELLVLFRDLDSQQWAIVNLGWMEGPTDRSLLPINPLPASVTNRPVTLQGFLVSADPGYQLQHDNWQLGWPKRIQQPDLKQFEQVFGLPLYPAVLRLTESLDVTLKLPLNTEWSLVNMTPTKHLGYAVQWFGLALALLGLLVWYGWLRHPKVAKTRIDDLSGGVGAGMDSEASAASSQQTAGVMR